MSFLYSPMDLAILLLCLVAAPVYVHSTVQLVESGPGTVSPGGSFKLTCKVTGDSITNVFWDWIRQAPGKGLEWVGEIDWDGSKWRTDYASSLQSRTTLTADSSRNEYYLAMRSLTAADTATYYCARRYYSSWSGLLDYWGQGTLVTVTSASNTAPTVFPLSPCNQDITSLSQVSIGCLVKGYFPQPATVQWNSGAITSGIHNFPPVLLTSNHYTHSSLLTIPVSKWQSESFECNVNHAATSTRINKRIDRTETRSPVGPEIHVFHSSCGSKDGTIQLWCQISGFYPKPLEIEWKVGSRSGLLRPYNYPPWQNPGTYTFSTASVVNITQQDWLEGNVYYCEVTHAASQTKTKSKAKKCEGGSDCSSGDINVYILPPTPRALYVDRNSKLRCVVNNLQNEDGLKITWAREKNGPLNPNPIETIEEPNGTYTVFSHLSIYPQDWESGEVFTCMVEHPSFVTPLTKKISKIRGKSTAPKAYVFPPHRDELNPGTSVSLTCKIDGFYPGELSVQWLQNHNPLPEDSYVTNPAMKNKHDDSFFIYSKLNIPRTDWDAEINTYTCMVVHEALPMKFTQRNISKTQGKK